MIVHIVNDDKFTRGYILFMIKSMKKWQHKFIVVSDKKKLKLDNYDNLIYLNKWSDINSGKIRQVLMQADKIIITGAFLIYEYAVLWPSELWKKTSIHFWGGDFYDLRDANNLKQSISNSVKKALFKKADSFIFLIDGEYEKFVEITGIKKKYFIAPMKGDPDEPKIAALREEKIKTEGCCTNIIVGNSATSSNGHEEVFKWIYKYNSENIKIFVPLSYGDENYGKKIIEIGKKMYGEKFVPMTEFMKKDDYKRFLCSMDIGIFNNNRQQAMGNISMMLGLGKKVYIRDDTNVWERYKNSGYYIFSVTKLDGETFDQFVYLDEEQRRNNYFVYDKSKLKGKAVSQWNRVFEA